MAKLFLLLFLAGPGIIAHAFSQAYTETEGRAAWNALKQKPLTEENFRVACDLMQDIGQTHIDLSYAILSEYTPRVRNAHNRRWTHILLMGWAKAKESLGFFEEAEGLYRQARENAQGDPRFYDEALVGTVLMYGEWGRADSLQKYASLGEASAKAIGDKENLSFICTFKATSNLNDTAAMGRLLGEAIRLADSLPDKNALFTARYNHALYALNYSPARQVAEFEALLAMTADSGLRRRPRLYERTAFSFRNPGSSVYYQLMQVNLLLTDYENAWRFAELCYDATVKPHPSAPQAAFFNAEMAIVKACQEDFDKAAAFLRESRRIYGASEDKIPYPNYFLAAGMLAEHAGQYPQSLQYFESAYKKGNSEGLHITPSQAYYAHALIRAGQLTEAEKVLSELKSSLPVRTYSSFGYFYYKVYAEWLKARGDYPRYSQALESFYAIKDSLSSLNRYRAIQEVETRLRVREKEQQISFLNEVSAARLRNIRRDRGFFLVFTLLALLTVLLLITYARNQRFRKRQAEEIARQNEALQENKIRQMEKQHRIEAMQGVLDAEENERSKIADQLHDEVGAMLSLATLHVSSTLEKGPQDRLAEEKLQKAQNILSSVATTIRDLSHRLTPLAIQKSGFPKAVEDLAYSINLAGALKLETIIIGWEDPHKYPLPFLNDCFRIVQELLHNILKHARAAHARLELIDHGDQISILVEDDGIGFGTDTLPHDDNGRLKGRGLDAIQSKIAYLEGRIEISPRQEKGSLIVIEIPSIKWYPSN